MIGAKCDCVSKTNKQANNKLFLSFPFQVEELALISRIREEQEAAQSDSHSNGGRISTLQVEEEEIHDAQLQLDLDAANKNILVDQGK